MITKKQKIRRNLDMCSEEEFAKLLQNNGFVPYYPFKDIGIDILATKNDTVYNFQLKSRTINKKKMYWFPIKEKKLIQYHNKKNMYYVLCALLPNLNFDFFILPIDKILFYVNERKKTQKQKERYNLKVKLDKGVYDIRPKDIELDINKYNSKNLKDLIPE